MIIVQLEEEENVMIAEKDFFLPTIELLACIHFPLFHFSLETDNRTLGSC